MLISLLRYDCSLPGEAQKIERFVEAFSHCYWEDNPSDFSSSDVVYILTYAIILLNSDAHNVNVRDKDRMSLEDFVKMQRGIDNGKDLDRVVFSFTHSLSNYSFTL